MNHERIADVGDLSQSIDRLVNKYKGSGRRFTRYAPDSCLLPVPAFIAMSVVIMMSMVYMVSISKVERCRGRSINGWADHALCIHRWGI